MKKDVAERTADGPAVGEGSGGSTLLLLLSSNLGEGEALVSRGEEEPASKGDDAAEAYCSPEFGPSSGSDDFPIPMAVAGGVGRGGWGCC